MFIKLCTFQFNQHCEGHLKLATIPVPGDSSSSVRDLYAFCLDTHLEAAYVSTASPQIPTHRPKGADGHPKSTCPRTFTSARRPLLPPTHRVARRARELKNCGYRERKSLRIDVTWCNGYVAAATATAAGSQWRHVEFLLLRSKGQSEKQRCRCQWRRRANGWWFKASTTICLINELELSG